LIAVVLIGLIGGIAGYFLTRDNNEIVPTVLGIPNNLEINDKILTWGEVENAESYIIYIDGEEYKADEASYSLDKLIEIKVYEIKIKAIGDGEIYLNSEWSEIIKYTVSMNLNAPNGLEIEGNILTWTAVENAKKYIIDIDGTEYKADEANYSLDELIEIKVYEIKVKAIGDDEIYFDSDWSEIIKHTVSTTLNVPNGLEIEGKTLTWTAVDNAKSYLIDIDGTEYKADEAAYSLDELVDIKIYEIKIKAIGDDEIYFSSEWSGIKNYTATEKLNAPQGLEIEGTTLKWTAVPHAANYKVWIDGTEYNAASAEYSLEYLTAGIYDIIKVKAIGDGEVYLNSEFSEEIEDYTVTAVLTAPQGLKIANNLFTWDAVPNAASYTVWINGEDKGTVDKTVYSLSHENLE
jgi:hypothetical protein